jgi:imidazole glycerol-phosphate synthase subunit HisF
MRKFRIIPRLDIKGKNLIKGIQLEGLKVLGDPSMFAAQYYDQGADELLYIDSVASLYERNNILNVVKSTAKNIFIPMTVGGGIRSVQDVKAALRAGADKVFINTGAIKSPKLISEVASFFGSQCLVISIEAKQVADKKWEVYVDNGREKTSLDVLSWVKKSQDLGVGEIFLTSIDRDGTKKGFDIDLVNSVLKVASIPVIASGGMGEIKHLVELLKKTDVDAAAIGTTLHYRIALMDDIRRCLRSHNVDVRPIT